MLSANKEKLHSFFLGSNQFIIPFFQRAYVWKSENWEELWENICHELEQLKEHKSSEHFIGTIIIKQADSEKLGALLYDLIDGQQRLTTVCLLLRVIHDGAEDEKLKAWIYNLLVFTDSYGDQNIRIIHSKNDKQYFSRIILSNNNNVDLPADANSNVVRAYEFFKTKLAKDIHQDHFRDIVTIVLERLPVIHMALSKNDDVQQIFDTINSLGVKLTTGELLKNFLFAPKKLQDYYQEYWESVFEDDEDSINFWNATKTAGRIPRTTIELFLHSYLTIKQESTIKIETLFKEYKAYLKDFSEDEKIAFAKDLKEYAKIYEDFPDGVNLGEFSFSDWQKRFFYLINQLDINTVTPLVLFIYKNITDEKEKEAIMGLLESYLVRRTICKLTTKNYNNLFVSIMTDMRKKNVSNASDFKYLLLAYEDETNRFPDDEEFGNAYFSSHLINKYAEGILFCTTLYLNNHVYTDNTQLNNSNLSVEHMMPKKWRNNWGKALTDERTRDQILLTLGNLTLVKGRLNSSMRDAAWDKKLPALRQFSTFRITTNFIVGDLWDEDMIESRGNSLKEYGVKIWSR